MASRKPRRRSGGRSSSPKKKDQTPLIMGGAGLLVLIVILAVVNSGGSASDQEGDAAGNSSAKQPAQADAPKSIIGTSSSKSGMTPDRPAPSLSQDTLAKMQDLYRQAKAISDEGMRLGIAGDNKKKRAKQSEAKVLIDKAKSLVESHSSWFEEADMEGWAVPGVYVTMNKIYGKLSTLQKTVRMNGGN